MFLFSCCCLLKTFSTNISRSVCQHRVNIMNSLYVHFCFLLCMLVLVLMYLLEETTAVPSCICGFPYNLTRATVLKMSQKMEKHECFSKMQTFSKNEIIANNVLL